MWSKINRIAVYAFSSIIGFLGVLASTFADMTWTILFLIVSPTLAVLIHELGHACAAWRFGMAVKIISVGPLMLHFRPTRLRLNDYAFGHDVGGYVLFNESRGRYLTRWTRGVITLAGPFANLSTAIIAYAGGLALGDTGLGALLFGFAYTSVAAFVISAWPYKLASGRGNDALQFIRDLHG